VTSFGWKHKCLNSFVIAKAAFYGTGLNCYFRRIPTLQQRPCFPSTLFCLISGGKFWPRPDFFCGRNGSPFHLAPHFWRQLSPINAHTNFAPSHWARLNFLPIPTTDIEVNLDQGHKCKCRSGVPKQEKPQMSM
jgi:hypothetical protein